MYLVAIDKGRFRKPVLPGDQLVLNARFIASRHGRQTFDALAEVDGTAAASARIMICAKR
jgi:3-hydroxyacyl-[acyl-carrier-protein] dehydratase